MYLQRGKRTLHSAVLINLLLCSPLALSTNQWRGEVTVSGRIITSACTIDTENVDQTITIATLPISQIIRDGQSEWRTFNIKLVNCFWERFNSELDKLRYFSVTFYGREDSGLFGVDGNAKGFALQISDSLGNVVIPGVPMVRNELEPGTMQFNYGLRLVGNNPIMKAGGYYSTVHFQMDYF
ncbi:PAP fimbrial minor pilin protein precursor [Serratia fonticola]|jgi:type 1 fimbria pilin|uniref:fimbrial protein n=1 Tax=Serratia fonticola TaxID=47917 RepID=UPI000BFE0E55|nr:fimbrial protein [Serratia fonticola]ATM74936.1 pilin [Serratia fonticola]CAI1805787.1 PAP fimbrial minor pilin protein precursor [Serratia fonticola]